MRICKKTTHFFAVAHPSACKAQIASPLFRSLLLFLLSVHGILKTLPVLASVGVGGGGRVKRVIILTTRWVAATTYSYILEYHSVCPLVRIGTPPPPLPQASVSPRNQREGHTPPAGEGVGVPIRTTGENACSTLSTLWLQNRRCPVVAQQYRRRNFPYGNDFKEWVCGKTSEGVQWCQFLRGQHAYFAQ
jgi:hypothetical protein